MLRQARIDAPGALHHIIARGIERRKIFYDKRDRDDFLDRLGEIVSQSEMRCYAWTLIPNHLLLKTGNVPVATVMRMYRQRRKKGWNRNMRWWLTGSELSS